MGYMYFNLVLILQFRQDYNPRDTLVIITLSHFPRLNMGFTFNKMEVTQYRPQNTFDSYSISHLYGSINDCSRGSVVCAKNVCTLFITAAERNPHTSRHYTSQSYKTFSNHPCPHS